MQYPGISIVQITSAKSHSVRVASHQPAFKGSCLTTSHTCLPCLPSRWVSPGVPGVFEGSEDAVLVWIKGDLRVGKLPLRPSASGVVNDG